MRFTRIILANGMFFALVIFTALGQPLSSGEGIASIRVEDLRRHLAILASDSLEGRETATAGQHKAAAYIASQFQSSGLQPAGDEGSFFQTFDVAIRSLDPGSSVELNAGEETASLAYGLDFLASATTPASIRGPVVFIGYMDSPLDSLQMGLLENSFVLAFAGRRSDATLSSGSRPRRRLIPQFPGSLGTIVILDEQNGETFEGLTASMRSAMEKGFMTLASTPYTPRRARPPVLYLSMESASRLLSTTGLNASQWNKRARSEDPFAPVPLESTLVSVDLAVRTQTAATENVLGLLEGANPKVSAEVVVLTAHYDHLGQTSDGEIYHGADDDGSGTSMLLELAEAFTLNSKRPDRSILFMALTGEEKGLLGSEYYVSHPVVPLKRTVSDLNIDMIGRIDDTHAAKSTEHYVYVIGSDKLSAELDSLLQAVNRATVRLELDYTYNDENDPNRFYQRSDHYNFARHGIPVVFFFAGVHEDYHRTTDTVDKIRFAKMVPIGRLIFQTGWELSMLRRPLEKNRAVAP